MKKKILQDARISQVADGSHKFNVLYQCPYCKQVLTVRRHRMNCPNCARELILWDLTNHV